MTSTRVVAALLLYGLSTVGAAAAASAKKTVLQTVPTADVAHVSGLTQGDVWLFKGKAGQEIDIRVDTRDDNYDLTSNLDPVLLLRRPDGSFVAFGDDEVDCTRPPVCGYRCPLIHGFALDQTGVWAIVVRDYGGATNTGVQCRGGAYELTVIGREDTVRSLRLLADDGGIDEQGFGELLVQQKGLY